MENSFESVARRWRENWRKGVTERYGNYVLTRLEADAFREIGTKPAADLKASDFIRMAKKTEARGAPELARRMLQTCRT